MSEEFEVEENPTTPLTDAEFEGIVEELIEDPNTSNPEIIDVEGVNISKIRFVQELDNGITQVYKVDGENVELQPIKSNRAPLDKLSEQLLRSIVKELIQFIGDRLRDFIH